MFGLTLSHLIKLFYFGFVFGCGVGVFFNIVLSGTLYCIFSVYLQAHVTLGLDLVLFFL